MEWSRLSHIAHTNLPFAGPYDLTTLERVLDAVPVQPSTILDVGCGEAGMLAWLLERFPAATAVGVDLALGRAAQRTERFAERVALIEADAGGSTLPRADLVLCVGSTHIFGGLGATRSALVPLADRYLLLGEGFWTRPPSEAALNALEASVEDYADLPSTLAAATEGGPRLLTYEISTSSQWDHYEKQWCDALGNYADEHPEDPDSIAYRQIAERHRSGYVDGYRGTLGFVLMLLELGA